ncbi:MAG: hypothetical protein ACKV2Q_15300 [Planctomycetaceae bacterium]
MAVELLDRQTRFNTLLPQLVEAYSLVPGSGPADLVPVETHTLSPLFAQLQDVVWNQLPTTSVFQATTRDTIAQVTVHCSELLRQRQDEIRRFVRTLCYHVVQFQVSGEHLPQARADALDKARRPLLTALDHVLIPLPPVLTAELIAQPLSIIQGTVVKLLQEASHTLAKQLIVSLHMLVELNVVGIIDWKDERTCKLNFFRHAIEQDQIESKKTTTVRRVERNTLVREEWERLRVRNRYFIERHEHHVMNAEARELDQAIHPIPLKHDELIDQIPEWLHPHLRVLEGTLILEQIVERQIREDQWQSEPLLRSTQTEVLRSTHELDPAILLGHFVLTGWGQRDVDREIHRRRREATLETQALELPSPEILQETSRLQTLAKTTAVTAVTMMLFSRLQPGVMLPLSLLLSAAAIAAFGYSLRIRSRTGHHPGGWIDVAFPTVAAAFGLLTVQSALFGLLYGAWSMLGLAVPLALVTVVIFGMATTRDSD